MSRIVSRTATFFLIALLLIGGAGFRPRQAKAVVFATIESNVPGMLVPIAAMAASLEVVAAATAESAVADANTSVQTTSETLKSIEQWLEEFALTGLKKKLLDFLVGQIISYIQGNGDGAGIIGDFKEFINGAAGDLISKAVLDLTGVDLCQNFDLKLSINQTFLTFPSPQFRCTLDDIGANIDSFRRNFSDGGWLAYNKMWEPIRNPIGSYIKVTFELDGQLAQSRLARSIEAETGGGFSSARDAVTGLIKTPGKTLGDLVSKAVGSDIDFLMSAEQLGDYVNAIVDAMMNRVISEGLAAVQTNIDTSSPDFRARRPGTRNPNRTNCATNPTTGNCFSDDYAAGNLTDAEITSQFDGYLKDTAIRVTEAFNLRQQAQGFISGQLNFARFAQDASSTASVLSDLIDIYRLAANGDFMNKRYSECKNVNSVNDVATKVIGQLQAALGQTQTVLGVVAIAVDDQPTINPDALPFPPVPADYGNPPQSREYNNPADQNLDILARLQAAATFLGSNPANNRGNRDRLAHVATELGARVVPDAKKFRDDLKGVVKTLHEAEDTAEKWNARLDNPSKTNGTADPDTDVCPAGVECPCVQADSSKVTASGLLLEQLPNSRLTWQQP